MKKNIKTIGALTILGLTIAAGRVLYLKGKEIANGAGQEKTAEGETEPEVSE